MQIVGVGEGGLSVSSESTLTVNQCSSSILEVAIMALKCSVKIQNVGKAWHLAHEVLNDCPDLYMLSSDSVTKYGNAHGEHSQGATVRQ